MRREDTERRLRELLEIRKERPALTLAKRTHVTVRELLDAGYAQRVVAPSEAIVAVSDKEVEEQMCAIYVPLYGRTHALQGKSLVTYCGEALDPLNFKSSILWWQPWSGVTCAVCQERLQERVPDHVAKKLREDQGE